MEWEGGRVEGKPYDEVFNPTKKKLINNFKKISKMKSLEENFLF